MSDPAAADVAERDHAPLGEVEDRTYPTDEWSLCLSGGGYRAMLFHTGALWRLHETGLLPRFDFFSSVSGGSINNGWLALNWTALTKPGADFAVLFVAGMRRMAATAIDVGAGIRNLFGRPVSDYVGVAYDRVLFGKARLQDLPDKPRFIFTASNLQSGALWRFSKPYMGDYKVGRIMTPDLALSAAVAASSAFPPVLSPAVFKLPKEGYVPPVLPLPASDERYRTQVTLSDGGVYDNLGLEPVIKRTRTVLVSDGGMPFEAKPSPSHFAPLQIVRVLDCEDNQVRSLRKRDLIARFKLLADLEKDGIDPSRNESYRLLARAGTYWGLHTHVADYPVTGGLPCPPALTAPIAQISTRLAPMAEADQEHLINWGYAVCDYAIRAHVDRTIPAASQWPYKRGLN
jgi:NTE family protein